MEIKVPALGESVTEATVAKWHKKEGESIKMDQLLVELETDKVTLEVNAPSDGIVKKIVAAEGSLVKIGDLLADFEQGGVPSVNPSTQSVSVSAPTTNGSIKTVEGFPSPAAAKIAEENKIDVSKLDGTGKDGRVTKGDVLEAISLPKNSDVPQKSLRSEERVKMSRLRKKIAERLKQSQNNAAILTTFNEVDMTKIMEMRNKYKELFEKKHGIKLGFMSFFVKAAVAALKELPAVNAEIDGEDIVYKNYCDIGVAVGTEQGLVVPIIRNAEIMSFAEIEKQIVAYGKKAREGKLTVDDMTGGTFTISNGGVYGSLLSTPIINPPQSAILGMHKTMPRPMVIDDKIEIRQMMYLALSYDHRIIDGKEAVTFLVRIKDLIENPERLILDL